MHIEMIHLITFKHQSLDLHLVEVTLLATISNFQLYKNILC